MKKTDKQISGQDMVCRYPDTNAEGQDVSKDAIGPGGRRSKGKLSVQAQPMETIEEHDKRILEEDRRKREAREASLAEERKRQQCLLQQEKIRERNKSENSLRSKVHKGAKQEVGRILNSAYNGAEQAAQDFAYRKTTDAVDNLSEKVKVLIHTKVIPFLHDLMTGSKKETKAEQVLREEQEKEAKASVKVEPHDDNEQNEAEVSASNVIDFSNKKAEKLKKNNDKENPESNESKSDNASN